MKKEIRLYNVLFPIWLLLLFPQVLVFVIPGNLIIDCLVLFCALLALKHAQKGAVLKVLWWKFWLLGFAADAVGVLWMLLGWLPVYIGHWGGELPPCGMVGEHHAGTSYAPALEPSPHFLLDPGGNRHRRSVYLPI